MRKWIKDYNEWVSIILATALFIFSPVLLRMVDGTAGAFDVGYLHSLIWAVIVVNWASGGAWVMFRLSFPSLYKWWDNDMEYEVSRAGSNPNTNRLTLISFSIYAGYFTAFVIAIISVV